jgi:tetratricopeptide (TPR) repeat protein
MALDVYQSCLGGMPNKIKFCACAKDMLGDLNKIVDALQGGQRAGALSLLNRQLELKGSRACLLTLKGVTQLQMGDQEGLEKTADEFLQAHPENPVACSLSAIVAAGQQDRDLALERLQRALADESPEMHEVVYEAIGAVSQLLIHTGDIPAARAHLLRMLELSSEEDRGPRELLMQVDGSAGVPMLLKKDWDLALPPPDAVWKAAFEAALQFTQRCAWAEALKRFQALAEELPNEPAIWKNVAILASNLARDSVAAEAWHRYAALPGVDLDEAVDAEALAHMLSAAEHPVIPEIAQIYTVLDSERVLERLLSERHVDRITADLSTMGSEDSPAPKAAFWLLDRALPGSSEGLTFEQVPSILGEMYLYGRETDREARLEFVTTKTPDLEAKADRIRQLLAEFGGEIQKEETIREVPAAEAALTWRWRMPNETTVDQRNQLIEEKRRDINLNVWPNTPLAELDGKRPAEVAGDPQYRIRLLAAILTLELVGEQGKFDFDFNELRSKLGLPLRVDIDPAELGTGRVSLTRMHLVVAEKLPDEQLAGMYVLAVLYRLPRAVRRLAAEVLRRPSLESAIPRAEVCHSLFVLSKNPDEALDWLLQAQRAVNAAKQSPARYLLEELELRRVRGEIDECRRVLMQLQTRHAQEPGVAQAIYAWLRNIGAITPDGRMAARPDMAAQQAALGPEAAPAAGLWTPDQPSAPPAGQSKPGIWVPGMD